MLNRCVLSFCSDDALEDKVCVVPLLSKTKCVLCRCLKSVEGWLPCGMYPMTMCNELVVMMLLKTVCNELVVMMLSKICAINL